MELGHAAITDTIRLPSDLAIFLEKKSRDFCFIQRLPFFVRRC